MEGLGTRRVYVGFVGFGVESLGFRVVEFQWFRAVALQGCKGLGRQWL